MLRWRREVKHQEEDVPENSSRGPFGVRATRRARNETVHVPTGKLTSQTKYTVELSRFSIFYARIPALRHNIIRLLIYPQTSEVVPCLACRESLKGFDALYHICFKGFCDCWSFWGVQYIYSFVLYCIDTVSTAESVNLSTEFTIKCPGNRPHYRCVQSQFLITAIGLIYT